MEKNTLKACFKNPTKNSYKLMNDLYNHLNLNKMESLMIEDYSLAQNITFSLNNTVIASITTK